MRLRLIPVNHQDDHFNARQIDPESRFVAAGIIAAICLLTFGYLWWGRIQYYSALYQAISYCGFAAVVILNQLYFREGLGKLGLRLDNLGPALKSVLPITGICAIAILGYAAGRGRFAVKLSAGMLVYFPWAVLQQYVLQDLLAARFHTLFGRVTPALISAALLFALVHAPNTPLMILTFVGGILWCWMFYRSPNIIAISLSQAFLAILIMAFFKFGALNSMQIGRHGFRYEAYGAGVSVAGGYDELHRPIIAALPGPNRQARSLLRLYRPSGELVCEWKVFPEYGFGANVAVGDLGFEPGDEIVAAPGPGSGNPPLIRIFNLRGQLLREFLVPSKGDYGAWVSVMDGKVIAAAGPAPGQAAEIYIFEPDGRMLRKIKPEHLRFENGIRLTAFLEPEEGMAKKHLLLALFGTPIAVNSARVFLFDPERGGIVSDFSAFETTYGLNLAPLHTGDGQTHFLTAPGPLRGYGPHMKIFDLNGKEVFSRLAYENTPGCGANVGAVDIDSDGRDEILMGEGWCKDSKPTVRIFDFNGDLRGQWEAF
jgi:membrane protease YdiL (CAAX protease family)